MDRQLAAAHSSARFCLERLVLRRFICLSYFVICVCVCVCEIKRFQNSDIKKLYFETRYCNFFDNQNKILNMSASCPLFPSRF